MDVSCVDISGVGEYQTLIEWSSDMLMQGCFVEFACSSVSFLARMDEVQEELLYYPRHWRRHKQKVKVFRFKFFMWWARRCQASYPVPVTGLVNVFMSSLMLFIVLANVLLSFVCWLNSATHFYKFDTTLFILWSIQWLIFLFLVLLLAHLSTKCSWWAIVISQCPSSVVRRASCVVRRQQFVLKANSSWTLGPMWFKLHRNVA